METSAMLSPLRFGVHHELMRKHPHPPEPSEPWVPPTPEPNFRIDDLLDFSNGELCDEFDEEEEEQLKEGNSSCGDGGIELKADRCVAQEESQQLATTSGLCVPSDELADQLEWLSTFIEDSSYSGDRQLASLVSSGCLGSLKDDDKLVSQHDNKFQSPSPISVLEPSSVFHTGTYTHLPSTSCCSSQHVPSRARSKRARAGSRIWSLDSLMPTLFDTRLGGAAAQESPVFFGSPRSSQEAAFVPAKKAKKSAILFKPIVEAPVRRCSHCLVTKTPQWRAGPMGPKTLCNACGVRYKSGRLVPEYRPAGSPTFVSEVHSNSHKRIMEMRRMKEMEENIKEEEEEEEEEQESDCLSQSESCKEHRRKDTNNYSSQEDFNGSSDCSEKDDDATGSICSEKEDPAGSICIEKGSSGGLVNGVLVESAADVGPLKRFQPA
ncbi:hypothetical protein GOP47_0001969 [Adiantum capillus-veneris]|uniref:GATA-type domain-containing protein n=1 Tax=Adiantum capillus-veneris TaxID=13818 RepID=A0A9D4ZQJ8_ADICA|nr:hypothetical protein GOP47_0001969 [Adiantum capillus-veneris]